MDTATGSRLSRLSRKPRILLGTLAAMALAAIAVAGILGAASGAGRRTAAAEPSPGETTPAIEGPFVHENLAIYLLRGPDRLDLAGVIPLGQALEQGKAVVRETGNVNELVVENLGDTGVFIEAGDIVKGGQQDRVLATDLVLPPKSGPIPIDAFCVEQGRWAGRGEEPAARFASSNDALPSRRLKLAANARRDQGAVWAEVAKLQEELATAAAKPVTAEASHTSLQLTLEHDDVELGVARYVESLRSRPNGRDDVVGYAFAIGGEIVSADLYGAAQLARERWPKLLRAAAVEAFAARTEAGSAPPPKKDAVAQVLARVEQRSAASPAASSESLDLVVESGPASYQVLESKAPGSQKMLHRALVLRDDG